MMNWKLLSLTIAMGLGMLIWLGSSHAQTPTPLEDCIEDFKALVDQWDSEAVQTCPPCSCTATKGKVWIRLQGVDDAQGLYLNFNARFLRDGSAKSCDVGIARHPNVGASTRYTYDLSGKEAAQWNKFLLMS